MKLKRNTILHMQKFASYATQLTYQTSFVKTETYLGTSISVRNARFFVYF